MRAGFVLVGGGSSRMGHNKALLPWHSGLLVEMIAARVEEAAENVALIGDPSLYAHLGFDCFPDLRAGLGPLAGIEAALEMGRGSLNLVLGCDMPGIETAWLNRLLEEADGTKAQCVATKDAAGIVHPLCAVFKTTCLPVIRARLARKRLKLLELLEELGAVMLQTEDKIWNVNTPREWDEWRSRGQMR